MKILALILISISIIGCNKSIPNDNNSNNKDSIEPVKVIFETDMCFDVDDVGALAVLHSYAKKGDADILGIAYDEVHKDGAAAISAINTFYGRNDIPIGVYKGNLPNPDYSKYLSAAAAYPHDCSNVREAVDMYVDILSKQSDNSVTIISVGFLNNLEKLMNQHKDLVKKKVKKLVQMGGLIRDDFNFVRHGLVNCTEKVLKEWPTLIVVTQLGGDVYTGKCLENEKDSPIRESFYKWFDNSFQGRSSWDEFAVLYAIKGESFFKEKWDKQIILQNGHSIDMEKDKIHYIEALLPMSDYGVIIDNLICSSMN